MQRAAMLRFWRLPTRVAVVTSPSLTPCCQGPSSQGGNPRIILGGFSSRSAVRKFGNEVDSCGSSGETVVSHDTESEMFSLRLGDETAYLKYRILDGGRTIDLYSTYVPRSLEGRGLGKRLADEAFNLAKERGNMHIRPTCWYIAGYLRRHPRQDLNYQQE